MDTKSFNTLRTLVYEHSGISLGPHKESLLSARVGKRMRVLGFEEHAAYLEFLDSDDTGNELVQLIDAVSTNVTSFYREAVHFDFLRDAFSSWLDEGQQRFRFWSAACSTGEEPYTVAITLKEALGGRSADLRILATDISMKVLSHSARGVYSEDKLESVPKALRTKYFRKEKPGELAVSAELKKMLLFKRLNLSAPPFPMQGPLDAVFCRNVMIYFDNTVRTRLITEITRLLKPGGYLFVGHTESLTGMLSNLKVVRPSIYVKSAGTR